MNSFAHKVGALLMLVAGLCNARPISEAALPLIVMATMAPAASNQQGYASSAIYTEAFRRLGYRLVVVSLPTARASLQADNGDIDGELTRSPTYGLKHPMLVRVDEPAFTIALSAYAVQPNIRLPGWLALREHPYRVEYRAGIEIARDGSERTVPTARLSAVPSTWQGLRKLAIGRTDVYIDFDDHVEPLLTAMCSREGNQIFRAGTLQRMPVHAYLNRKNFLLAEKLATTLREMKRDGTILAYRRAAKK